MNIGHLKYAELFALLAFIFLLIIFSLRGDLPENLAANESPQQLRERIKELEKELENARKQFPPNIIIEGAGKYAFPSGRGELTGTLRNFIANDLVNTIEDNFDKYDIDTVVVIGHTDGQAVGSRISNLDKTLEKAATGTFLISELTPGSNADLGLIRAMSVVKELQRIKSQKNRLQKLDAQTSFRAYSAGQLTLRDGRFARPNPRPDAQRRRIEIRFTKTRETTTAK